MEGKLSKTRNLITDRQIYTRLIVAASLMLLLSILIRTAWLSDDAFISLRTLDNWVNGLGLTWNPPYRVQAFTHPLWLFLLAPFYYFTREPFYTTLFVSILCSFGAVLYMAGKIRLGGFQTVTAVLLLSASKAFTDYATSGLENPLAYLLAAAFISEYRSPHIHFRTLLYQALLVSLILTTRQDLGIIFLPALAYSAIRYRKWAGVLALFSGLIPWMAWIAFSVFYFGFPVPNTAYAKLQTGIPEAEILGQGLHYFYNSLLLDPVTLISLFALLVLMFRSRRKRWMVLAGAVVLYLLYILQIGGDFMSGRFFAVPFFVLVLGMNCLPLPRIRAFRIGIVSAIGAAGIFSPYSPLLSGKSYRAKDPINQLMDRHGVVDERGFYYGGTGLLSRNRANRQVYHIDAERGKLAKAVGQKINYNGAVGMLGFYAGPSVYVLDYYALGDPLLSRIPVVEQDSQFASFYQAQFKSASPYGWRIGHFRRAVPEGYVRSLLTGENAIQDPEYRKAWDLLKPVLTDPLFSEKRMQALKEIILTHRFDLVSSRERTPWKNPPYAEILESDPGCVSTLYLYANQAFVTGNFQEAYSRLIQASRLSPVFVSANQQDFANAWYALAMRFAEMKRYTWSLDCARRAESLGIPLAEETRKQLQENQETEALFFPERTKVPE